MKEVRVRYLRGTPIRVNGVDDTRLLIPWIDNNGKETAYLVGAQHGRSLCSPMEGGLGYIVHKGTGLSYTSKAVLNTGERDFESWGILQEREALRDFSLGLEVQALGIKTNEMLALSRLPIHISIRGEHIYPVALSYRVECPYRICDGASMSIDELNYFVSSWQSGFGTKPWFDVCRPLANAAHVLFGNLRTMMEHGILHNAISPHNYTWALELLDFELAHSPRTPYTQEEAVRIVDTLRPREVIQTYEVLAHIAERLGLTPNWIELEEVARSYGFYLEDYEVELTFEEE